MPSPRFHPPQSITYVYVIDKGLGEGEGGRVKKNHPNPQRSTPTPNPPPTPPICLSLVVEGFVCINKWGEVGGGGVQE